MFKVVAIWSAPKPEEAAEFERDYLETHCAKARKVPHLQGLELIRTDKGLEGHPPGFYRAAVLSFADEAAFEAAAASPEWRALREDAGQLIEHYGVTLTVGNGTGTSG
jgi:uncharacterized protein (TIGR02118 family)